MAVPLHFERWGNGLPAYIFLHGFLGNLDNWRTIARSLALPGRYYLIDARNHGRSPHTATHRYPDMAEDLIYLLDQEALPSAHVLGHSMGGKTAMYAALHFPERIASLIVVDIAPRAYAGGHEALLAALAQVNLQVQRREEIEAQLAHTIADPGIRQFLLKNLARQADGTFYWRINLPVLIRTYPFVGEAITGPAYKGPALFLRGERSTYIRAEDEAVIRSLFPRAELRVIPNAGHWVHVDNPAAVLSEIQRFWGALSK
ncbi:MAG: alpha/beta fold hydrolase [Bacteroidia bacterium]|jgi:pimeloyl-ACP methyl ester carboxylesterase|nr:alpha/beta fold hydrolase [Bacteroidia bacterium]GIV23311.1 MAG: alpha/beta hydrolase [Bacteroidia bacterium]